MGGPWNSGNIEGTVRWIRRVWNMMTEPSSGGNTSPDVLRGLRRKVHQTVKSVTRDFERFEFNTTVSSLMELQNEMAKAREQGAGGSREWDEAVDIYLRMMAPITPHIAEELWAFLGKPYSIHTQSWPKVDEAATVEEQVTLVVQVNGKVRDRITVPVTIGEADAKSAALASPAVQKFLGGKPPKKVIVVRGKLVNIVG